MNDIQNRKDIHFIMDEFYKKLLSDDVLLHFFEDIIEKNHLEEHLEIITDFWNGILFSATDYNRNAMHPHLVLNQIKPFKNKHFKRWLLHFTSTIEKNFKGEKAEMAKTRALSIATVMEIKMMQKNKNS